MSNDQIMLKALGDVLKERLGEPPGSSQLMLKAIGDVLKQRLADIEASRADLPTPNVDVSVPVPAVYVTVDMTPVAAALDRMSAALMAQQAELFGQLLQALAQQPPVVVNPVINVPPAVIDTAPIAAAVELLAEVARAPRPKRTVRIQHVQNHDGTESTVAEET